MIDIHCHILPGVDDGSQSIEHSLLMLKKQKNDGVKAVILTPHVQSRVQTATLADHQAKLQLLKSKAKEQGIDVQLYLGAEVFYRSHLVPDYQTMSMNGTKYVLIEFPPAIPTPIQDVVIEMSQKGFIAIVAHVERYEYLTLNDYLAIKRVGGLLQMNASAAMNQDHQLRNGIVTRLLRNELIDFIATDSHNIMTRIPNLKQAYDYLENSLRPEYLEQIFYTNAKRLIE